MSHDRPRLIQLGNGLLVCALAQWSFRSQAATQLPVPCVATSCGTSAKGFVTTGAATAVQSGNTLSVNQTTATATLNWSSFNIGANGKVVFQQPSTSAVALNRIFDANPSSIFGSLTANGTIYLINANGFLFGSGAVVNVGGLVASSLNISNSTFSNGILTPGKTGAPALTNTVTNSDGSVTAYTPGDITVQSGASLATSTSSGGLLLLAAPNVTNAGSLSAPNGQVILAAGQNLYLQASQDPDVRGLVVEVEGGGTVANQLSGSLSASTGNVTLTGLMVNQDGRVSATTSVAANGSVILQAADTLSSNYTLGGAFSASRGGTVELGAGSITEVLPDYADTTTAPAVTTQLQSSIKITGQQVLMHDATIDAPDGTLAVLAAADSGTLSEMTLANTYASDPTNVTHPNVTSGAANTGAEIRVDSGTTIDLAGSDAELPMSANLVTVQLRSNEFADDPTQRGGALQSTPTNTVTVTVDMRADGGKGTPIADLTAAIGQVGQTIAQRTEAGGSATFLSEGDVVLSTGASVNVSGGYTTYLGGTIQTTKLVGANGQLYDIGSANPLLTYKGVINPTLTESYDKWGVQEVVPTPGLSEYQSTYVQGASAGTVQFAAPNLLLAGSLQASTVSGPYQRSSPPSGGTLIIGDSTIVTGANSVNDYFAPSVSIAAAATPIVVADGSPLLTGAVQLPAGYLTSDGFTNTTIYSDTSITLPAGAPLVLTPNATLSLIAPRIDVDSSITDVAGSITVQSVQSADVLTPTGTTPASGSRQGVGIGDGVTLDVSGQWTNDNTVANGIGSAPILQNAGSINLQLTMPQSELVLGDSVALKANGGAWLESGGTISYGMGGKITLDASPAQAALQLGENMVLQGFGTGTASGGTFSLLAPRIEVSEGSGSAWTEAQRVDDLTLTTGPVLQLYAPLFSNYGFSSINLTATGAVESYATSDVLTVASGTTITAQTSTLQLGSNYATVPTGTPLAEISQVNLLPLYERPPTSISLDVLRKSDDELLGATNSAGETNYGLLDIQAGASISVDPGATIVLEGEGGVLVAGTLRAPGGSIQISIPSPEVVDSSSSNTTNGVTDPGFVPTLGIDLASTAVLDVGGTTVMTPNSQGLLSGTVMPGGSVTLEAARGTVVTETGSSINIAGTSATLDVANSASIAGDTREIVASAGGSLTVSSPESISLLGNLSAAAGVGNSGSAAAGSLEVDLVRGFSGVVGSGPSLPTGTLQIELVDSTAGATPSPADSNIAVLGAQQLMQSGIDSLTLRAGGTASSSGNAVYPGNIEIDVGQLSLARQLILDAPSFTVQAAADLSAPFVEIGNLVANGSQTSVVPTPYAGSGTLTVSAQQMVLVGNFALEGASSATFSSSGDVQLEGTTVGGTTGPTTGSIVTSGSLAIDALRVYPDTYTYFYITSLKGSGGTVSIGSTGSSPGAPLSADGLVSIKADNISVTGTLYAPFGNIALTANNSLTLGSGSLISVSGEGLDVPFGETELNQGEWIYTAGALTPITVVPTKQISLSAPNIAVQSGATTNIAGGGDLYAYEWVPGTGGSYDNLSSTAYSSSNPTGSVYANLYAILPASKGQAGPYDPEESGQSVAGQTIYLSGGAGIAAGYYTLLPARYALETGAVLIQLEPTYNAASTGQIGALANGVPVIAGYLSTGTTGLHTGATTEYEGVAIYPSGYAEKLASYTISDASTYFSAIATAAGAGSVSEPADAGILNISVTPAAVNSLNLQGSVLTSAATGGQGAIVNLSASDLEITSGNSATSAGALAVSGSVLQSWNASTLTLGGAAMPVTETASGSTATNSSTIAVAANTVTVDSGVQLTADQIVLVAQQSIDVQAGASLMSTSGKNGTVLSTLPSVDTVSLTDIAGNPLPQAALLAVSDLYLPIVSRTTVSSTAGATISVAQGAALSSGGALSVDAAGDISLAGTLSGKGASWSLSSGSVAFVGSGTSTDTLNIGTNLLSSLQGAGAVRIASEGGLDIDAPVSLGVNAAGTAPTLTSLTLIGNSINNQAGGNSAFGADNLTLAGDTAVTTGFATPPAATAGTGTLSFVANTLTVGPGLLSVSGFAQTTAQVAGAVVTQVGSGTNSVAGYLNVGGNLTINAAELNPAADAADEPGTTIATTGTLTIGAPTVVDTATPLIGGSLTLSASDIEDAGKIIAPSGVVELNSSGNLHLASGSVIDASSATTEAVSQSATSPGGMVALTAGGNLTLDSGSSISVAGSANAPAGSLSVTAPNGTVTLSGSLSGAASGNVTGLTAGGSLTVDAGYLTGGLMSLVNNSGFSGFTESVNIRVQGDSDPEGLNLASGKEINANQITLTADNGTVDIAGTLSTDEVPVAGTLITPTGAQRGLIDLSGGTGVVVESTGQLHADGTGATGRGGEIDINAGIWTCSSAACTPNGASITLDSSHISTLSVGTTQTGDLVLRAPVVNNDDVAINSGIGAELSQVGQVIVEPVMVSTVGSAAGSSTVVTQVDGDAALANAISNANTFLTQNAQAIAARLGTASTSVQAGVELRDYNPNDSLVLDSNVNLSTYSSAGNVINLALRAAGNLSIDATVSDGFTKTGTATTLTGSLAAGGATGYSGSLSFVAGADLSSANPLSVVQSSPTSATLNLGPGAVIRTGTGDINLAAAGNIEFGTTDGGGASVYTAGLAGATAIVQAQGAAGKSEENYGTDGGNVTVLAGGDVVSVPLYYANPNNGNYGVSSWLPSGATVVNSSVSIGNYGVNFDKFFWNVGALGGGDVTVVAAGSISNLSAATSDSSARPDSSGNTTQYGVGGGLRMAAVGDISSVQVYVADGVGTLNTNAGLTALPNEDPQLAGTNLGDVGSSFALGAAQISVWARQSVQVDAVYNPTFVEGTPLSKTAPSFFTYGSDSALDLSSTDGDVTLNIAADTPALAALVGSVEASGPAENGFVDLPASLSIQALQQDINFNAAASLYPSSTGQLVLFAGRDINGAGSAFVMSDSAEVPTTANTNVGLASAGYETGGLADFQGAIHVGDSQPALISAGRDILDLSLFLPKAAQIQAGRDIVNLSYQGQNLAASDITLITAGRDITYPGSTGDLIQVGGPGSVDVFAGRNIDLNVSAGITTIGDLGNPNLPTATGADLTIAVGYGSQGADYSTFVDDIIAKSTNDIIGTTTTYQEALTAYVDAQLDKTGLTFAQAEKDFLSDLSTSQQAALVDDVFFNELTLSGRAANAGTGVGFTAGYAAIDALYPGSRNATAANPNPYNGSLDLIYSQIYTLSGGNISILVPGGSIDVGLAFTPTGVETKQPGQLGIVTEGSGNIDIYSLGDVNVNASRIFTLGGGNILIWSDEGSIDAGNGSKSSLSAPPPTVSISTSGQITVDYTGAVAGSGIQTIQTDPDVAAGNVDLDAPVGTVDAGDAGISAAGNVNIAAAHVIGALNISFGGTATGVPSDLSGLAASLSGVSAVANSATTSSTSSLAESSATKETAPIAQTALSWLEVFVTGLGEENCKQDDLECLKRQRSAAP